MPLTILSLAILSPTVLSLTILPLAVLSSSFLKVSLRTIRKRVFRPYVSVPSQPSVRFGGLATLNTKLNIWRSTVGEDGDGATGRGGEGGDQEVRAEAEQDPVVLMRVSPEPVVVCGLRPSNYLIHGEL